MELGIKRFLVPTFSEKLQSVFSEYLANGFVVWPEDTWSQYVVNAPRRLKGTVVRRIPEPMIYMDVHYPKEYVESFLRGGLRTQVDVLNFELKTHGHVNEGWGILNGTTFIPGKSIKWVDDELDCFRLYTSHAERARGVSLFRSRNTGR